LKLYAFRPCGAGNSDALSSASNWLDSRPAAKIGRPTRPAAGSYIRSIRHRRRLRSSITRRSGRWCPATQAVTSRRVRTAISARGSASRS